MMDGFDLCVIGGGASGLLAAAAASMSDPALRILILEKNETPGKKLSATGNGRCNLSNRNCPDWEAAAAFFSRLGLLTRMDADGRIYPHSEDARDVVRILTEACAASGVRLETSCRVTEIVPPSFGTKPDSTAGRADELFLIRTENGKIFRSRRVLLATGGKSAPAYGTTGDGYVLARKLGHHVERLRPVLTGIETAEDMKKVGLSGLRQKGRLTLRKEGSELFSEEGEIQFADYGISGICVFNASRFLETEGAPTSAAFAPYELSIDFLPAMTAADLARWLADRAAAGCRGADALCSLVKAPLAKAIAAKACGSAEPAVQLKDFRLHPTGLRGWQYAQVTRGGVDRTEINEKTMESRLMPGLYLTGEVVDYDGPCGGYNLQFAWTSGLKAGRAAAASLACENHENK